MNRASDEIQKRLEIAGLEIAEYLDQVESKIFKGTNKNDTHHHEDNPTHKAMFRKDYTTVIGRLLPVNPFLENSLIKVGADIAYSEKVCAFIDAIPKIGQKQYKEFVDARLIRCKKLVSDTIAKNNFVTPAKSTAKAHPKKTSILKESDFNKLKAAPLFRPSLFTEVFKKEMTSRCATVTNCSY